MDETKRTLELKLGLTMLQTAHLFRELEIHFADAWVKGYESIIPARTNHPKDWHVLAAAVVSGAQTIVTFNLTFKQRILLVGTWKSKARIGS
jgi:hypothetical protein